MLKLRYELLNKSFDFLGYITYKFVHSIKYFPKIY